MYNFSMKFKLKNYKILIISFIVFFILNNYNCLKLESLPTDMTKLEMVNIKLQESDRQPAVIKRYTSERRLERNRLRDLENQIMLQRHKFEEIITLQNEQIRLLSKIAHSDLKMLAQITDYNPYKPTRKETEKRLLG